MVEKVRKLTILKAGINPSAVVGFKDFDLVK